MRRLWTLLPLASLLFAFTHSTAQAWTILWSDDFETSGNSKISASNVTMTREADPIRPGTSILFSDIGNTENWGAELSANGGTNGTRVFKLSDFDAVAGVDRVFFNFDIFVPTNSVSVGDSFGPYIRFVTDEGNDGGNASGASLNVGPSTLTKGVWHTFQREFSIPATAKNNHNGGMGESPTTRVAFFVSFNDAGTSNAAGALFYVDNIQVTLTPEPSQMVLTMAGLGALLLRRKRHA